MRPPPLKTPVLPSNASLNAPLITLTTLYVKIVGEVAKMYTDGIKYDGHNSNFANKRTVFEDVCRRADLLLKQYIRAFPIILKGLAQDFYYNNRLSDHSFVDSYKKLRTFFEPLKYLRTNLNKWNSIILDIIASKHLDKLIGEVVQLLVNELSEL